eukprot:CAMPEP_0172540628 /NCGR_PEP_ID=MMETSP1067-20121228/11599_1 /TAXON_ID=265564 ORGANISM="Thalassiosira punctigera, Strain Tpunct2005C2" /NCGR_SAMPLE_ID=MMETSP1067 /ASSEMBLY_ACC=CAM_ASM_000444 /LENGTH=839 /DNA_ID=CAMNT_0013326523 /DNA_START=268 /DNA_END=2787 /DNA_ORIENTATION=+
MANAAVALGVNNVDKREPADSDSDSEYGDFLAFLGDGSSKKAEQPPVVQVQATVVPKKVSYVDAEAVPVAVAEPLKKGKAEQAPQEDDDSSDDEDLDWLNGPKNDTASVCTKSTAAMTVDSRMTADTIATAPAPIETKSLLGKMDVDVDSVRSEDSPSWSVSDAAAAPAKAPAAKSAPAVPQKAAAAPKITPTASKPAPQPQSKPSPTSQLTSSDSGSVAPSIAASVATSLPPSVVESIADTTLAKLNIPETAPSAVAYFTKKAAVEKALKTVEARQLSVRNMPDATRYFDKMTIEEEMKKTAEAKAMLELPRAAAIEYFTAMEIEAQAKKKAEIQAMKDNPPEMSEGQAYFTNKWLDEKAKQKAENEAMKENPPASSVATAYFAVEESKRKLEIEKMVAQPAPPAIEYFTSKDREEKRRMQEAAKRTEGTNVGPSVATQYFTKQDSMKAEMVQASQRDLNSKSYEEPLPVDYFTKLNDAEKAEKAKEAWELASANMPKGVAYFTAKAEEDKARKRAEFEQGHGGMSIATSYFNKLAAEKDAASLSGPAERMPVAIQKFSKEGFEKREKQKAEIKAMKESKPEMAPGQAYFTNQWLDQKEAQKAENEAMKENPPPSSVATAYFAVKESQRKLEIEKMTNQPAPPAIEYFTRKAEEEKRRVEEAAKKREVQGVACVATQHFEKQKSMKIQQSEAKKAEIKNKPRQEPLPVDYFTRLGEQRVAEKAKSSRALADSCMPDAVRHFTQLAEEEKAQKLADFHAKPHESMSVATQYFNKRAAEEKAERERSMRADPESMPAAIQYFSLQAEEERRKKKEQLEVLKNNPHVLPPGVAHFTPDLQG